MEKLTKEYIVNLLETNDKAVQRALIVIYENQTATEQNMESTIEHNNIGFTGTDGQFMTSLAKFALRNGYLTPKQIAILRKKDKRGTMKIGKYWRQLVVAAEKKAAAKQTA